MKDRGLNCPHTKNARRRLINERKRLLAADNDDECAVVSANEACLDYEAAREFVMDDEGMLEPLRVKEC